MIETRVTGDFMADGVAIIVSMKPEVYGAPRMIMRVREGGLCTWEPSEPLDDLAPTLKLPDDAGRSLLDALLRYYEGASDMHTVRSDLLHERGRVDRLIGLIGQVLTEAAA